LEDIVKDAEELKEERKNSENKDLKVEKDTS